MLSYFLQSSTSTTFILYYTSHKFHTCTSNIIHNLEKPNTFVLKIIQFITCYIVTILSVHVLNSNENEITWLENEITFTQ